MQRLRLSPPHRTWVTSRVSGYAMNRWSRFISVDDAARKLAGVAASDIVARRFELVRQMQRMGAAAVVSLGEYRNFAKAKAILTEVLRRRGH